MTPRPSTTYLQVLNGQAGRPNPRPQTLQSKHPSAKNRVPDGAVGRGCKGCEGFLLGDGSFFEEARSPLTELMDGTVRRK